MQRLGITVALVVLGCVAPAASSATSPLAAHQEPAPSRLVALGDRVEIAYKLDRSGVKAPAGDLYVRNDTMSAFERVPMSLLRTAPPTLRAVVPARLIRGSRLFYHVILRDPATGRTLALPARSAWILSAAAHVRLGAAGRVTAPEAVVATAEASEVGWDDGEAFHAGPQTFLVARGGAVWLHDSFEGRLLGLPELRSIPVPGNAPQGDVAEARDGTFWASGPGDRDDAPTVFRLDATGKVLGSIRLPDELRGVAQLALRVGPDGRLYVAVNAMELTGGAPAPGWMPVTTTEGTPLSVAQQRRGIVWGLEPVAGKLSLVVENHARAADEKIVEGRVALVARDGRIVRAWRISGRGFDGLGGPPFFTPELVGGDPVVLAESGRKHVALRLGGKGVRTSVVLARSIWGDQLYPDVRVGPDGKLYQLTSSRTAGVRISRYSLR